jgi:glycosyltransferase involved in cell wall biosynthesis
MSQALPQISVLLPVYNAEKTIAMAIESILNQSFKDFELILIDDGSRDQTLKVIEPYLAKDSRIVLLKNPQNMRLAKSLNRGIEIARGKYLARMDADDYSYPDRFEKQFSYMEAHPDVGISGGTMEVVDANDNLTSIRRYFLEDEIIRQNIFYFSPFCHPAIIMRKSVIDQVGGFVHEYNPAEDYELYFRIGKISKFGNLDDVLLRYKILDSSMTGKQTWAMEKKSIQIRWKYFKSPEYHVKLIHRIYNFMHFVSLYILSSKLKVIIYQALRDEKAK